MKQMIISIAFMCLAVGSFAQTSQDAKKVSSEVSTSLFETIKKLAQKEYMVSELDKASEEKPETCYEKWQRLYGKEKEQNSLSFWEQIRQEAMRREHEKSLTQKDN